MRLREELGGGELESRLRLIAPVLLAGLRGQAPGALARHLAPKAFAGMCPPPRDSETAQYTS